MGGSRYSILGLMRLVAWVGVLAAAFFATPSLATLFGIPLLGLALWGYELYRGRSEVRRSLNPETRIVMASLGAMFVMEVIGAGAGFVMETFGFGVIFAVHFSFVSTLLLCAVIFQLAAFATLVLRGASPRALAGWGSLHGALAFAAATMIVHMVVTALESRMTDDLRLATDAFVWLLNALSGWFFMIAVILVLAILIPGERHVRDRLSPAWRSLLLAQVVTLVFLYRSWFATRY